MSNFITNVLKLVSGSVTAQILGILLIPIITRIYNPDDFGIFQLFISISGILVIVSTFSYQLAIMLPKTEEDAANITSVCVVLVTLISILTGVVVLFIPEDINIFNTPGISKYLPLLPVIIFLNGMFFVQNYWLSRKTRFGVIAGSRVSNTLTSKISQIGLAKMSVTPFGLIGGYIAGYAFADIVMLKGVKKDIQIFKKVSVKRMKEVAIQYKKFPLFSFWSSIANTISPQVPAFLLAYFYSTAVVGHFSLANQVVNLPMGIVGGAIGQVFFQKVSEVKNGNGEGDMKVIVGEVYNKLISIGLFPMILLVILGEQIFTFAFGEEWGISGTYVRILVPWIFLVFLSSPITTLYNVFEKQKVWLIFSMSLLVSRVVALVIGGRYGSPEFALALYSFTGIVFWLWNNAYLLGLAGISKKESLEVLIKYAIIGFAVSIPLILVELISSSFYVIIITAVITTVMYYAITLHEDPMFKKMFSSFLIKVKNRS
ncbi:MULTISPECIES: lipopolysaccharide biosynthesis protein [Methanosarcina]|jgi:O-antigen/teichoic acid export membrane protein|uniref:Polysaccharide biosynthesis protein n=8 Tax=Methanosarcina mazei TaxID=2209 RepID=A0A0F8IDV6_METMZ|nr:MULTISPECIES: lipopolysaccharide biosynthesis protein [Methanosarcina]AAM30820.1 O-antigen translocase [Methanosarcina mazei Go1]AGF96559.1 O-antigen flippase Wzx [Methanosarcina mazei Tuc01]AKB39176.1 O-antigen flippase Wzx [Methanosarcina mazei WWM610]AKB60171.1 O-antigen flippase Wzx [Methanosarcina mazei SarPi]AKB63375.1 O-antigen flippase Wzx [Methanosarcina mazei S-6]